MAAVRYNKASAPAKGATGVISIDVNADRHASGGGGGATGGRRTRLQKEYDTSPSPVGRTVRPPAGWYHLGNRTGSNAGIRARTRSAAELAARRSCGLIGVKTRQLSMRQGERFSHDLRASPAHAVDLSRWQALQALGMR